MREKLVRTVLSVLVVVGGVLLARWTIRSVVTRAYHVERAEGSEEIPVVPAKVVYRLAAIVPEDLRVNIAGLVIRRRAERLNMPYSLAVDVAEEKASSAGWERLDDENALTLKNLSGMERVYRTPEGSIVLREVRAIKGDNSLMEDFAIPAEMIPAHGDVLTPDSLARRSARRIKELLPAVLRDVVVGSPLMTELIERGGGAALIIHSLAEMSAKGAVRAVEEAARRAGWAETKFDPSAVPADVRAAVPHAACWTKMNLTFHFEAVPRPDGSGSDVNYRFTDDEVYIPKKGQQQ